MKAIMFDFDGTLSCTGQDSWVSVWRYIGKLDKDQELYDKFKNRELTYEEWCDEVFRNYRESGVTRDIILHIASQIKLLEGVSETFHILKNAGYSLNIVSGGIKTLIIGALGENAELFDNISANEFIFDENNVINGIVISKYDYEGKADYINLYMQKNGISPQDVWFVGNSYNDEWVHKTGCHTICINPDYDIINTENWDKIIYKVDNLKDILPYLGLENCKI